MNAKYNVLFIKPVWTQINLIMTKNITRVVVKTPLKNDSPIINKSFKIEQCKNETEYSKEVWNLKSTNNNAEIA